MLLAGLPCHDKLLPGGLLLHYQLPGLLLRAAQILLLLRLLLAKGCADILQRWRDTRLRDHLGELLRLLDLHLLWKGLLLLLWLLHRWLLKTLLLLLLRLLRRQVLLKVILLRHHVIKGRVIETATAHVLVLDQWLVLVEWLNVILPYHVVWLLVHPLVHPLVHALVVEAASLVHATLVEALVAAVHLLVVGIVHAHVHSLIVLLLWLLALVLETRVLLVRLVAGSATKEAATSEHGGASLLLATRS